MTDKWQCSKCKELKVYTSIEVDSKISPESITELKCCCRLMRNLTEDVYLKEKSLNDSGARDLNIYRK